MTAQNYGWYFTKEELMKPVKVGGTDYQTANTYRQEMYQFIAQLGHRLGIPQLVVSTCAVYFHRFFARKDFVDYDRNIIAIASFFLAAKVEETHKKLRDVLLAAYELLHGKQLNPDGEEYNNLRKQILVAERLVLQTIAFDLSVEHPYRSLMDQAKSIIPDEEKRKTIAKTAWKFVNDSYMSTVCLQFRPQMIASAAIYLAGKFEAIPFQKVGDKDWWQILQINLEELEEITTQILAAFPSPTSQDAQQTSSNNNRT